MAFRGVFIKLPDEVVKALDALAPHVGEVHPARVGRTSVILAMLRGDEWAKYANVDPNVATALDDVANLLDRSRL